MKSGKRPGESRERNTAIYHWIVLDIRGVIERDEVMPYQLRIDPKRYQRQTDQDKNVSSLECCSSVCVSLAFECCSSACLSLAITRDTASFVGSG
jgi:hypothetical protein